MELKPDGVNPPAGMMSKVWKDNLKDHIKRNCQKFGSQREYSESVGVSQTYISMIVNDRYESLSRIKLTNIAVKVGFENSRKAVERPEKAVEYDNTMEREREEKPKQHEPEDSPENNSDNIIVPIRVNESKDLKIINHYMKNRTHAFNLPQDIRGDFIMLLLQKVIRDLEKIRSEELC